MLIVSDTSPLRALQAIDKVHLVQRLYAKAFIPPSVAGELLVATPTLTPLPFGDYSFFSVVAPLDLATVSNLRRHLDPGESEAIALAIEKTPSVLLIDEAAG